MFNTATIYDLLKEIDTYSQSQRGRGGLFERLIAKYLMTDPQYADRLSDVWLWSEWPYRWGIDDGIDIVARERGTGDYWAIQCKYFSADYTIQKNDVDSFFTASGKRFNVEDEEYGFTTRLIISTTDKWSNLAEKALQNQSIPVIRLGIQHLKESPVDWNSFSLKHIANLRLRKKHDLREHQMEALEDVREGFKTHDRGKLIMACGTGKTFTSLRIAEDLTSSNGRVLFLAPSISLVSQSLREWTADAIEPFHAFVVCSDTKVGKDNEDIPLHDLAFPATTDTKKLVEAVQSVSLDRRIVIFSTYQSIQVIADAQRDGFGEFDLIVCDEAHRTTGITLSNEDSSEFVKVHQQNIVQGKKRLYMTATPRIYNDKSKSKANANSATLYSMDDENVFGPEFHKLGFGKAVTRDLLSEYKVLIVAVDEDRMATLANEYNSAYRVDDKKAIDTKFATKVIGSWKGLSKQGLMLVDEDGTEKIADDVSPMRRAVAFSRSIKDSKNTTEIFADIADLYRENHSGDNGGLVDCALQHVDGGMNSLQRQNAIDWLKSGVGELNCRILSNARCLSEGIDVPALDAVIFFDTRESIVDIVQSVGRVMRKADHKQFGYIILPVGLPLSKIEDYNNYVDSDPQFKAIWKVIKALRAHDESLVDEAEFRRKIKVINGSEGGGKGGEGGGEQLPLDIPTIPIDTITEAIYAAIPKKLGDREYWADWAEQVAKIVERLISRIHDLLNRAEAKSTFESFLKGLRDNLNPYVDEDEAVEMLAQHVITRPVFEALFEGYSFTENNPVSRSMQAIIEVLDDHVVSSETNELEKFYANVRERIQLAKSDKSRQEIIRNLYETFFNNAFPRMAERLGIVYTPVPVVDFILHSAEVALQRHFGSHLTNEGVQILDPFTGTGTFIVRLLQSGLIHTEDLLRKYKYELNANEIVLLAYYIASINIETAQHAITGEYQPFDGIVLTDTFQMNEAHDMVDKVVLPENNERVNQQKRRDIRVIVGNPPYKGKQGSANDNNQNIDYPTLKSQVKDTYAAMSTATNKNSLYDPYILAIRWASNRIHERGIIAFVTNGKFIDGNAADGLRKCLANEFSHLYVFNLRGDQRTNGEQSRQEGGKIFGSGSRTTVAITVMVKDPTHTGDCRLYYHDIGDYLSREEKFAIIEDFHDIDGVPWGDPIHPNDNGDWINQRDPAFKQFMELGNKKEKTANSIFKVYSRGLESSRDAWVYNYSRIAVENNMSRMIDMYNCEVDRFASACKGMVKEQWLKVDDFVVKDPKKVNWSSSLYPNVKRGRKASFRVSAIVPSMYRPFVKKWLYFDDMMNHRVGQCPKIFPTPTHNNLVISVPGNGGGKPFSCLVINTIADLNLNEAGSQCFPLYEYVKVEEKQTIQAEIFNNRSSDTHGYIRHDAISDDTLLIFQEQYRDMSINKEDLFWYVYGVLHSPEYKQRFGVDLRKMMPRIPFAEDFWTFSKNGRALGELHLSYETVEPYDLIETPMILTDPELYRVDQMAFGKSNGKTDKSVIVYNKHVTLSGVPKEAYEYVINGKPVIEWIMEFYSVTTDQDSGIKNDPNKWSDDPRYILDLLKRIVRISVESLKIIKSLPPLNEK